jgi:hypothetical protein
LKLSTLIAVVALAAASPAVGSAPAARAPVCAGRMTIQRAGHGVKVRRGNALVAKPRHLDAGDRVRVPRGQRLVVALRGNVYVVRHGQADVECGALLVARGHPVRHVLAINLDAGQAVVEGRARGAALFTPEAVTIASGRTRTLVERSGQRHRTTVSPYRREVVVAKRGLERLRVNVWRHEAAVADRRGLRVDTYPFSVSPDLRRARRSDGLVPFWRDGLSCSAGCHAPGAIAGWPLRPFHRQHALRAGLNELRPANFHLGIDIQAGNYQRVYPMSTGPVHVIQASGPDERVQVGRFIYWHINHRVHEGQLALAYRTTLGVVKRYYHHLHLSEVAGADYLNPLRPGGRNLRPWSDSEPPVIGMPTLYRGGRVNVAAFDPQSYIVGIRNVTPVLAPAAVAWRLFDARGRRMSPLEWALRGSHHLPDGLKHVVYAPGARNPGFHCFTHHFVCIPTWRYHLAGGLTPTLSPYLRRAGRYRLAVYAWDWAGNTSARDLWFRTGRSIFRAAPPAPAGRLRPRADVQ